MTDSHSSLPPRSRKHGTKKENQLLQRKKSAEGASPDTTVTTSETSVTIPAPKIKQEAELYPQMLAQTPSHSTDLVTMKQSFPAESIESGIMQPRSGVQSASAPHRPGLAMLVLIVAVFMSILDTSIVNVAIPKMMAVFSVGTSQIQWIITAYTLVVGALVPVTGYLGDRFGYKRIFLYALVVFTIGSGLCGMAWSNESMIIFRIIQAIGGGAVMPVSMAMAFRMFPPERRGLAMGIFGIAIMFAPATGPTLSGYITEFLNWRLIFYINVPIGIIDFFAAIFILREIEHFTKSRFDVWGFLTSSVGFASLLYGLGIVADKGWADIEVISFIAFAIISLVSFVVIELTVKDPMVDLRLLKNFVFSLTLAISSITSIVLFSSLFLLPVFLQNISGLSAIQTGLLLLPQALLTGMMMPLSGFLFDKIGARWLSVIGLSITAYSLYLTHFLDVNTSFSTIISWLLLRAVGIGMVMMPVTTAGMNTVEMKKVGQATAISNTVRQVSASFGIAWLTVLLSHRQIFHAAVSSEKLNIMSPNVTQTVNQLQAAFSAAGQPALQAKASSMAYLIGKIQVGATVQAMDDIFWVTSWLTVIGIVLAFFLKNTKPTGGKEAPMMSE